MKNNTVLHLGQATETQKRSVLDLVQAMDSRIDMLDLYNEQLELINQLPVNQRRLYSLFFATNNSGDIVNILGFMPNFLGVMDVLVKERVLENKDEGVGVLCLQWSKQNTAPGVVSIVEHVVSYVSGLSLRNGLVAVATGDEQLATLYTRLGFDPTKKAVQHAGRNIPILSKLLRVTTPARH